MAGGAKCKEAGAPRAAREDWAVAADGIVAALLVRHEEPDSSERAGSPPAAMEGLSHVHVTTKERDKAAAWLAAHTGLRVSKPTPRSENVLDGRLNLLQVQSSAPLAMEPDGSAWIASVGIAVSNLSATLASWAADGGAIVSQRSQCGVVEVATATDPWGVLFELIQSGSPGLSHVNVVAHEPDELLGWYAAHLGGVRRDGPRFAPDRKALRFPDTGLLLCFSRARPGAATPTDKAQRRIDHLGFARRDAESACSAMAAVRN